ncbi:MAG: hypothetical protein ACOY3I_04365 [Verrucomicrobiota bacterium]
MTQWQLTRLFHRCCGYLRKGNAIAVYDEVLPVLRRYQHSKKEVPQEIQALMASCALLDCARAGVRLEAANIVQVAQQMMS